MMWRRCKISSPANASGLAVPSITPPVRAGPCPGTWVRWECGSEAAPSVELDSREDLAAPRDSAEALHHDFVIQDDEPQGHPIASFQAVTVAADIFWPVFIFEHFAQIWRLYLAIGETVEIGRASEGRSVTTLPGAARRAIFRADIDQQ